MESKCTVTPYRGFESRPLRHLVLLAAGLAVGACGDPGEVSPDTALPALPGLYAGTFPCHDCPGIDATLWLRADQRFFIRQHYPASGEREAIDAYGLGRWWLNEQDGTVVLDGEGPQRILERRPPDGLLMRSDSVLEHRLERESGSTAFTSRTRLTGTIRRAEGGLVFTECLTGYEVAVRDGGEVSRLRHQMRSVRAEGDEVFVEFEGRFQWSADDAPQSVTIDRFATIRENGAC